MKTFSDTTLPLLFPDMCIEVKRFKYVKPFVKWTRSYFIPLSGYCFDLPYSDLEFRYAFPEVALEQGRISELEYKKIKKYAFT